MLFRRRNLTRHDLGREEFVKTVREWKGEYHKTINNAQRLMGGSMDWPRETFTMDATRSRATAEAFCRLHSEGHIYRANRLVNWRVQLNTALSNLELENLKISGRTKLQVPGYDRKIQFGVLTYFNSEIDVGEGRQQPLKSQRPGQRPYWVTAQLQFTRTTVDIPIFSANSRFIPLSRAAG